METIKVLVGSAVSGKSGIYEDDLRPVVFQGEELGQVKTYGFGRDGLTDTRHTAETLYKTEDDRLIVHSDAFTAWQGEPCVQSLVEVTEADLAPGGRFERLGRECGYTRPLTLEEALAPPCDPGEDPPAWRPAAND